MKKTLSLIALTTVFFIPAFDANAQGYNIPDNTPAHIRRGVESQERTAEQIARDSARLPAEVLTLSSISEGDHVLEFTTFGQYYTPMLVEAVGPTGKVEMYDMPYMEGFDAHLSGNAFADAHPNANYYMINYGEINFPTDIDLVYNILYYHDLGPQNIDTAILNSKLYTALKPGGKYVIVDHKAEDGSGWRDSGTIHRIGVEVIIEEITAAGFKLITDSAILSHPEDDKSVMVFAPGTRGGTDRATLIFQKPFN